MIRRDEAISYLEIGNVAKQKNTALSRIGGIEKVIIHQSRKAESRNSELKEYLKQQQCKNFE